MWRKLILVLTFVVSIAYSQIQVRGGELFSLDQQLYGRYELRMRTAQGDGILSTFFTYENDGWMTGTGNPWREIDIEVLGRYTDRFQTNIITGTADGRITSEYFPQLNVNPAEDYHTYIIEWTPDYISFSFDGKEVRRTETGDSKNQVEDCRNIPQSYRFNMWANAISSWVGPFSADILPKYQFVNWIKYYSYSEQDKTFTLEWTDDFNTLDNSRWSKATHTMEDFTQFDTDNVLVKDGTLVLALTDMQGNGLNNIVVPPDEQTRTIKKSFVPVSKDPLAVSVKNGLVLCSVNIDRTGKRMFRLSDFKGRIVDSKTYVLGTGFHSVELGKGVSPGVYLLQAGTNDKMSAQTVSVTGR
ncbi:MAG: family 16 glycosylhydrolase [Fibrobacter sp.]|nr:family 16 glycosylhydrolase [Fibrobacter sp.]